MFCSHCGVKLPDGAAFCGHCGKPVFPPPDSCPAPRPTGEKPFRVTRGMTIGVLVAAALVVVLIVSTVTGVFGGDSQSSPENLAARVESLYNNLVGSEFDEDARVEFADGILDLMPPDMVDDMLDQYGYTREELLAEYGSNTGESSSSSGFSSLFDSVSFTFEVALGSQLSADELESLSESFASVGYDYALTDGYELTLKMIGTFNEDYDEYSAGDTETVDFGTCYALEIDGTWYLWGVHLSGF